MQTNIHHYEHECQLLTYALQGRNAIAQRIAGVQNLKFSSKKSHAKDRSFYGISACLQLIRLRVFVRLTALKAL